MAIPCISVIWLHEFLTSLVIFQHFGLQKFQAPFAIPNIWRTLFISVVKQNILDYILYIGLSVARTF